MAEPSQDPVSPLRQLLMQFIGGGGGGMAASRQGPAPAPAQQAAPASPSVPVVTSGANQVPAERPSLLESLRENVNDMVRPPPSTADRLAALGAGMLTNPRSRSGFFGDLAAGIQAQQQFEGRAREERRKALELQAEIARRDEELRLKQEELRDPSVRELRAAQAEYYRRRPEMAAAGAGARGRLTEAQYANIYNQAEQEARRQFPDPTPGMPDPTSAQERRRMDREEFRNRRIEEIMMGLAQRQGGTPTPPPQPAQPRQQVVPVPLTGAPRPAPTER